MKFLCKKHQNDNDSESNQLFDDIDDYHSDIHSFPFPVQVIILALKIMGLIPWYGKKPIVVVLSVTRPMVMKEVEPEADAILMTFGIQYQAEIEIVNGNHEPEGLLPMQLPKDMETVERQMEDLPRDMECYKDSDNNRYDFAYGLNWSGQIDDNRVKKYR